MSVYTKRRDTMQHTEVVYLKDGEEFWREEMFDVVTYESTREEPMTSEEIEDWL